MRQRVTFEAWVDNQMSPEFAVIEKDGKRAFQRIDAEVDQMSGSVSRADDRLTKLTKRLGAAVGAYFAIDKVTDWGRAIVDSTAKYQKFSAVLENTLGSRAGANDAMTRIQQFASSTPFQVDELTGSFVKLANQGFIPTMNQMRSLGDLASSTGKGYDQLTEAIIDAQTGEFERLKDFGIRASKSGDQVTFTFKNQKRTVDFSAESIRKYILSLGDAAGVSGAMAKIMGTTGGKISNLKDQIDQLNKNIGDRYRNVIDGAISGTGKFVNLLNDLVAIPVSQKLEDQRREVNLLASELVNSQTPLERRNEIYAKLNEIAPDVIKDISAENIEMGKLRANLTQYNNQMIKRIVLQKMQEKADKASEKEKKRQERVGETGYNIQNLLYSTAQELRKKGQENRAKAIENIMFSKLDAGTQAKNAAEYLKNTGGLNTFISNGQFSSGINYVSTLELLSGQFKGGQKKVMSASEFAKELQSRAEAYAKAMGFNLDGNDNGDGNGVTGGNGSGNGSGSGTVDPGSVLGGISGDNRTIKNINISINKLGAIEKAEFLSQQDEQDLKKFQENLQKSLMIVLNDTNTMVN